MICIAIRSVLAHVRTLTLSPRVRRIRHTVLGICALLRSDCKSNTTGQVVCAYLMIPQTRSSASTKAVFSIYRVLPGGVWKLLVTFGSQYIALKAVAGRFYSSNLVISRNFPEDRHFRQSLSLGPRVIIDGRHPISGLIPTPIQYQPARILEYWGTLRPPHLHVMTGISSEQDPGSWEPWNPGIGRYMSIFSSTPFLMTRSPNCVYICIRGGLTMCTPPGKKIIPPCAKIPAPSWDTEGFVQQLVC